MTGGDSLESWRRAAFPGERVLAEGGIVFGKKIWNSESHRNTFTWIGKTAPKAHSLPSFRLQKISPPNACDSDYHQGIGCAPTGRGKSMSPVEVYVS
jgi:hypothetical protein